MPGIPPVPGGDSSPRRLCRRIRTSGAPRPRPRRSPAWGSSPQPASMGSARGACYWLSGSAGSPRSSRWRDGMWECSTPPTDGACSTLVQPTASPCFGPWRSPAWRPHTSISLWWPAAPRTESTGPLHEGLQRQPRFGAWADSTADVAFLPTAAVALAHAHQIPAWASLLVVLRFATGVLLIAWRAFADADLRSGSRPLSCRWHSVVTTGGLIAAVLFPPVALPGSVSALSADSQSSFAGRAVRERHSHRANPAVRWFHRLPG